MANIQLCEQLIRRAAHDTLREIFDEVPLDDPNDLLPDLTQCIGRFVEECIRERLGTATLVMAARAVANAYYELHLKQKHHIDEDRIDLCRHLSQGLLIGCGHCADRDDPVADLHAGHYTALDMALRRMMCGQGIRDCQYRPNHQFVMPYQVAFSPN